jgi:adenylate kinase
MDGPCDAARVIVTLLGIPGAGKTTLGMALADEKGWSYCGGGQILRDYVRDRRPGWAALRDALKQRRDTDPQYTLSALEAAHMSPEGQLGMVLDGFPKRLALVDAVEGVLDGPIDLALLLTVRRDAALRRILTRVVCLKCGRPSTRSALAECPRCSGPLARREGDDLATLERNDLGAEPPDLLANYFRARGRLVEIDANQGAEAVHAQATSAVANSRS